MPLEVEVALIGNPDEPNRAGVLGDDFFRTPYSARRRVSMQVEEHEDLATVMQRAAVMMGLEVNDEDGLSFRGNRILFYKQEDEQGIAPRGIMRVLWSELTLVDKDGRAIFGVYDHHTVRFTDLIRAHKAGAVDGDPLRPYLVLDYGWGDAPPPDWATLQQVLEVAWHVLQDLGVLGGASAALFQVKKWLSKRLGSAREALASHPEWAQKGYRPDQFESLLATRRQTTSDLSLLLGCSEAEAEAVFWVMGFAYNSNSREWQADFDEAAEVLGNIRAASAWLDRSGPHWEVVFRGWLLRYLETGNPPPFESLRPHLVDDPDDLHVRIKPTLGEKLDAVLGFLRRKN